LILSRHGASLKLAGVNEKLSNVEYRCPGQDYTISRAVHLARLSGYYTACRECPRRGDTAGLSARQVRRLAEIHAIPHERPQSSAEDIGDTSINDLTPQLARTIAIEFARRQSSRHAPRAVAFASDGRLATATIVAAVAEGIRWTGCEAVDLGATSAPCMAAAIEGIAAGDPHAGAIAQQIGGIYVGNPGGAAHTVGMKFWSGGERLSPGEFLNPAAAFDRPARRFGPLRRMDAAEAYLSPLRPAYHALRPLRFVLHCNCGPVVAYLEDLLQSVACRVIPAEGTADVGGQVVAVKAHFGMKITDDGEKCRVFDEQGRAVAMGRLAGLLTIVGQVPIADSLLTLTLLLAYLSRDDVPISAVLDRDAARQ
jgi:hypothetical protein